MIALNATSDYICFMPHYKARELPLLSMWQVSGSTVGDLNFLVVNSIYLFVFSTKAFIIKVNLFST